MDQPKKYSVPGQNTPRPRKALKPVPIELKRHKRSKTARRRKALEWHTADLARANAWRFGL